MSKEKLNGEVFTDNIDPLILELNANKTKLNKFTIDRIGEGHYRFEIDNDDPKSQKKLFKIIDKHIKKEGKGKVVES